MWKKKLGFSIGQSFGLSVPEAVQLVKESGFDALSPEWKPDGSHQEYIRAARECGLELQSLHAPFLKAKDMWDSDEEKGAAAVAELLDCLNVCVEHQIPVMVVHAYIGFKEHEPTPYGLVRFQQVADEAQKHDVKIALENTEGEEYLAALMQYFTGSPAVGFCWDAGHEMCYSHSKNLLQVLGDRLIMTHLNDNLGISRFDGKTFWTDDLHLLPYDGIADWDVLIQRLRASKKQETLNFELGINSKRGRHENDVYEQMPLEQYLAEAYKRACRIAFRYAK